MPLIGHIRNARATSADAAAPSDAALFRAPEDFAELGESLPAGSLVPVLVIRGETPTFLPLRVPE